MTNKNDTTQNTTAADDEARRATTAAYPEDGERQSSEPSQSSRRGLSLGKKIGIGLVAALLLALIVVLLVVLLPTSLGTSQQQSEPSAANAPTPTNEPMTPAQQPGDAAVSVSVSIDSQAVGNPVSADASFSLDQGATAYDALMACDLSVNASPSQYGVFVEAIGGLAGKEHGDQSGWMYTVNEAMPEVSCDKYVLQDGDSVQWYYAI